MSQTDILLTAVVGLFCGILGQLTCSNSRGALNLNLVFGCLGAAAGVVLSRMLNAPEIYNIAIQTTRFPVIYALIGSVLFVAAIGILIHPSSR